MNPTIKYIFDHATEILAALAAMQIVAKVVVKLTPTQKDDAILAKLLPWVEKLAGFLSVQSKHTASREPVSIP